MSIKKRGATHNPKRTSDRVQTQVTREVHGKLGLRIRELRRTKDWSQEEFAQRCGVSLTHMGEIERGQCDVRLMTLLRITKRLGMTVEALLEGITLNVNKLS